MGAVSPILSQSLSFIGHLVHSRLGGIKYEGLQTQFVPSVPRSKVPKNSPSPQPLERADSAIVDVPINAAPLIFASC